MRHAFVLFVLILIIVAGNWAIYETEVSTDPIVVSEIAPPEHDDRIVTDNIIAPTDDDFSYTFERPIFSPSRRPFVAPDMWPDAFEPISRGEQVHANSSEDLGPDDAAIDPNPPELSILGISIGPEVGRALVVEPLRSAPTWFEVDMDIDNWTIFQIDSAGISLKQDGRQIRYDMYPSSGNDVQTNAE